MATCWTIPRAMATLMLLIFACVEANVRPIIGMFSQPAAHHSDYIAASYIKWIESAGGRVVPIPYHAPMAHIDALLPQLNGLLFPGGASVVNEQAFRAVKRALELNDKGIHFPVWGTCLGFEWLLQIIADDERVLERDFDAYNISMPLNFTSEAKQSHLFGQADQQIFSLLEKKAVTMNNHEQGITPKRFANVSKLTEFFTVLSTNVDRTGRPFISAIEGKRYPVYGVQFHPEKNAYEYGELADGTPYEAIDHSPEAIAVGQYFANFVVAEARKNDLKFNNPHDEKKALIYNFHTSTISDPGFVQIYLFKHRGDVRYW